jgi:hypothetical protein
MKKKVKSPKAVPKAKPSRKLPSISPVGLSPETKSLLATLSQGEMLMLRAALEASVRSKLSPIALLESYSILGSLFPFDELMRLAEWSTQDLEAFGWKMTHTWPDLFTLYKRGENYRAELSDKLAGKVFKSQKGNDEHNQYGETLKLQQAIFLLKMRKERGESFDHLDSVIVSILTEVIGGKMMNAWRIQSPIESRNIKDDLNNSFVRAVNGLMKLKHPLKAKHTTDEGGVAMWLRAIKSAQELCGELRRLPAKAEVRSFMEEKGYRFSMERSKGVDGKWRKMFIDSGLEDLKD